MDGTGAAFAREGGNVSATQMTVAVTKVYYIDKASHLRADTLGEGVVPLLAGDGISALRSGFIGGERLAGGMPAKGAGLLLFASPEGNTRARAKSKTPGAPPRPRGRAGTPVGTRTRGDAHLEVPQARHTPGAVQRGARCLLSSPLARVCRGCRGARSTGTGAEGTRKLPGRADVPGRADCLAGRNGGVTCGSPPTPERGT
jgi:hypothetical protein